MLTIKNIDTIVNVGSSINNWRIGTVTELEDLYAFSVIIDNMVTTFYLNRESTYVSGRNEPVYRLYKDFDQSKINRWLSRHQIEPYMIGELIDKMLKE
jgi:hypothetical protein